MKTLPTPETGWLPDTPVEDNVVRRFVHNQGEVNAAYARSLRGRTRDTEEVTLADAGSVVPYFNQAILRRPVLDSRDGLLGEVEQFYAAARRPATLLSPWPTPDLTSRGWSLVGHPMLVVHSPGVEARTPRPGVEVHVVADPEQVLVAEEVVATGYPLDRQGTGPGELLPAADGVRLRIGSVDGIPCSVAASHVSHGIVNLCLAATLPAARRRGVWDALVRARCADAPDLPAVAYTSDYSRPGFVRMGFVPVLRFTLWIRGDQP